MEEHGPSAAAGSEANRGPEEIRKDIEQTREELGDTIAAVADRADVKKQAKEKAGELGTKVKAAAPRSAGEGIEKAQRAAQEKPVPLALAGAFLAGFLLSRLLSR